jgi:LacI family transcriptional regulator
MRVALLIETSKAYGRGLLAGIRRYVKQQRHPWSIFLEPGALGREPPPWLERWDGDGVIARVSDLRIARAIFRSGLPAINLSSALPGLRLPCIQTNPDALARLAVRHLFERGLRRLAFVGDDANHPRWSRIVGERFAAAARSAGGTCEAAAPASPATASWEQRQQALARWVRALPKPLGVLAVTDPRGHELVEACRRARVAVPQEAAVLGIENDELLCDFSDPPLSSIAANAEKIGHDAAALLAQWIGGHPPARRVLLVEPLGVVTRQSTDVQAHSDPIVGQALRFIRARACDGIRVQAVVDHVRVSRSSLERRFGQALGRTPHDEIVRIQLERAKDALTHTDLKTAAVARSAGFSHVEYMGFVFRRELGVSPGEFRRLAQARPPRRDPDATSSRTRVD